MSGLIVIGVIALAVLIGTRRNRYNFGSRQEVVRLFGRFSTEFQNHRSDYVSRLGKQSPFRGLKFAR